MTASNESPQAEGFVSRRSLHSVEDTASRIIATLAAKGIKLFAVIDHSGEAAAAGLAMPPTRLLIFGNAKAGTPLMIARPSAAIDLPLKILVWRDGEGAVWTSWNSVDYLARRHNLPSDLLANIGAAEPLATHAGE